MISDRAKLVNDLIAENENLRARIAELEADGGAAAWILEWMVADKYKKPDIPILVDSARRHYRDNLNRIAELEAALKSIANNTCCGDCQEAKRVAISALCKYKKCPQDIDCEYPECQLSED